MPCVRSPVKSATSHCSSKNDSHQPALSLRALPSVLLPSIRIVFKQRRLVMKETKQSSEARPPQSSAHLEYALRLRKWELDKFDQFCERTLSQRVMLALMTASLNGSVNLRLTEIFVDGGASEVGIRKCLKRFGTMGLIKIARNPRDRRTKLITPNIHFQVILKAYAQASNKPWKETQARY